MMVMYWPVVLCSSGWKQVERGASAEVEGAVAEVVVAVGPSLVGLHLRVVMRAMRRDLGCLLYRDLYLPYHHNLLSGGYMPLAGSQRTAGDDILRFPRKQSEYQTESLDSFCRVSGAPTRDTMGYRRRQ